MIIRPGSEAERVERIKQMPRLKQEIIGYLFTFVSGKPYDQWYRYKGTFIYQGADYVLECDCKHDRQMFTYKNFHIEYKQKVIELNDIDSIDDDLLRGMLH